MDSTTFDECGHKKNSTKQYQIASPPIGLGEKNKKSEINIQQIE